MIASEKSKAELAQRLLNIGPPPSWWRVLAWRRWCRAYDAALAMDTSWVGEVGELLAEMYKRAKDVVVPAMTADDYMFMPAMPPRCPGCGRDLACLFAWSTPVVIAPGHAITVVTCAACRPKAESIARREAGR